jgi:hypothetical protein
MFCSFRDGKAGLGNDYLYIYRGRTGRFEFVGAHLTGIQSNPYVHGMDWRDGRLHVSWVYRGFVHYEGWDDPLDTKHKQQSGPNKADNNHNICYAYSDDGYTWKNGAGGVIANLRKGDTIDNNAEGTVAFAIPKGSGLSNQEAQAVDQEGGVHVLNRDTLDGGGHRMWKHYYRSPNGELRVLLVIFLFIYLFIYLFIFSNSDSCADEENDLTGAWTQRAVRPVAGNARGRLAVSNNGDLFIVLPDFAASELRILKASKASGYAHYDEVWTGRNLTGEPLVDSARLGLDNVLSVLALAEKGGQDGASRGERELAVLDFQL